MFVETRKSWTDDFILKKYMEKYFVEILIFQEKKLLSSLSRHPYKNVWIFLRFIIYSQQKLRLSWRNKVPPPPLEDMSDKNVYFFGRHPWSLKRGEKSRNFVSSVYTIDCGMYRKPPGTRHALDYNVLSKGVLNPLFND